MRIMKVYISILKELSGTKMAECNETCQNIKLINMTTVMQLLRRIKKCFSNKSILINLTVATD